MTEICKLSTADIIHLYSEIIKELKNRKVIRTNNVIGDLGEYLAIEYYRSIPNLPKLSPAPVGTENIDAIDRNGKRYSIKSCSGITTGVFYGLNPKGATNDEEQKFEHVIICVFSPDYEISSIYQMDWNTFLKHKRWHSRMQAWNLTLSQKVLNDCVAIYHK